jgi:putative MATE family efflux protein
MLSGSIFKGILTICIPIMIMNVTVSLFNIIDMTVLKMFDTDGGYTVGAVGACGTLITFITGLLIGVSSGANVVIAKYIGKRDGESAQRAVGASLTFAFIGGVVLSIIGVTCAELFLRWMNCSEILLPLAARYFRLYFAGVPLLMVNNFSAAILRSTGNSKGPMLYLTLGGAIKVASNFIFVAGLGMKVEGVAIATVISWGVSSVLSIRALIKSKSDASIKKKHLRPYKKELLEVLSIGVPAGLQQGLYSIANVIIMATVNSLGPDATTGVSIATNFDGLLYQIILAPSLAVMPYVSQNIGNRNVKRASRAVREGILITIALGATFGALSAIFSTELSSIMSDNPAVIAYSKQRMIIISSTYFICGINEVFCAALRGMDRPLIPTCATLIYMFVFRFIWVYQIFPLFGEPNLTLLYLVWPVSWVLSIATLLCFYIPRLKKLKVELG